MNVEMTTDTKNFEGATPADWLLKGHKVYSNGRLVATSSDAGGGYSRRSANATLLAAAPTLLSERDELVKALEDIIKFNCPYDAIKLTDAFDRAKSVLSRCGKPL